ncbi:MAG: DUF58 domain-containing protein [Oscillospiraceae bacterium]|nr:DUF58 domain-containing protein [Oscillospiraceae bacterium]
MTKNRILYINVIIFSLSFVFFFGGDIPYTILYTTVSLLLISIIYTLSVYAAITFHGYPDQTDIIKGGSFNLIVDIENKWPLFFPYVSIKYKKTDEFLLKGSDVTISVNPFAKTGCKAEFTSKYRGRYTINNYEINIMDFLGVINIPIKKKNKTHITVYPQIAPIGGFPYTPGFDLDSITQAHNVIEDTSSVSDIRSYYIGDEMKRIHWKLSAKTRQIKIKNYEKITMTSVLLLLDLSQIKGSQDIRLKTEDKMIEAYISILYYFLRNYFNVTMCFYDSELVTIRADGMEVFETLYQRVSLLEFKSDVGIEEIIDHVNIEGLSPSNICVFTSNLSRRLVERLLVFTEGDSRVSMIYMNENNAPGTVRNGGKEAEDLLEELRKTTSTLKVYPLHYESKLNEVFIA